MRISKSANNKRAAGEPLFEAVEKVAKRHFFEFFSSGACAYGAASTECRESLAAQALFADLPHMSPNPNKAIRGCGPLSTLGFFDRLKGGLLLSL